MSHKSAQDIRSQLKHPVIDGDGHQLEFEPVMQDYIREVAGGDALERMRTRYKAAVGGWAAATPDQRRKFREVRGPWGLQASNAKELATVMSPKLLYSRLDEFGIDFAFQYPTMGAGYARLSDPEDRGAICRALNKYNADMFSEFSDRMTPAAMIPTVTPEEAIAELDHAVGELGMKAIVIQCANRRPIRGFTEKYPDAPPELARHMTWLDFYGIDSIYDYDPLWKRCSELNVAVTAHQAGFWGSRTSISNYSFNHIGLFGSANEAFCKSLIFAGVRKRFPNLQFGVLEGGVSWACNLLGDLIEHWEKRNKDASKDYDPALLDQEELKKHLREHGGETFARHLDGELPTILEDLYLLSGWTHYDGEEDEWKASGIERLEDIRTFLVDGFTFGCEAEDAAVPWALSGRAMPFDARLRAMFGSDIGHWDVPEPNTVLGETYEAVEDERLTPEQFQRFVFDNAVKLHAGANRDFFRGTVVENEAKKLLAAS